MKKIFNISIACFFIILSLLTFVHAYRIPKPQRITDFDQNGLVTINESLEQLWDITNGRISINLTTVNPDGVVKGNAGDIVLLLSGGTYYLEVCAGGTVWLGEALSNTP